MADRRRDVSEASEARLHPLQVGPFGWLTRQNETLLNPRLKQLFRAEYTLSNVVVVEDDVSARGRYPSWTKVDRGVWFDDRDPMGRFYRESMGGNSRSREQSLKYEVVVVRDGDSQLSRVSRKPGSPWKRRVAGSNGAVEHLQLQVRERERKIVARFPSEAGAVLASVCGGVIKQPLVGSENLRRWVSRYGRHDTEGRG